MNEPGPFLHGLAIDDNATAMWAFLSTTEGLRLLREGSADVRTPT